MSQIVMSYALDDTGKMIDLKQVRELIKCENCSKWIEYTAICSQHLSKTNPDDFCSQAERRHNEAN